MSAVSRKASNALTPKAQAAIHQTSPTVSATRTAISAPLRRSATARRSLVTALNAPFMARVRAGAVRRQHADLAGERGAVEVGGVAHDLAVLHLDQVDAAQLDAAAGRLDAHERRAVKVPSRRHSTASSCSPATRRVTVVLRVGHRGEQLGEEAADLLAPAHDADRHDVLDALLAPVGDHGVDVAAVHRLEVGADLLLDGLAARDPLPLRLRVRRRRPLPCPWLARLSSSGPYAATLPAISGLSEGLGGRLRGGAAKRRLEPQGESGQAGQHQRRAGHRRRARPLAEHDEAQRHRRDRLGERERGRLARADAAAGPARTGCRRAPS